MGRAKYTEEKRHDIILQFLSCTRRVIEQEGIEQVSIRRIARCAGFAATTLYMYFQDADEMLTLASMSYLEQCYHDLLNELPELRTPYEIYRQSWRVYARHAFTNPQIFYHLLFHPHTRPMRDTIARYYDEIYPGLPAATDETVCKMMLDGNLRGHNLRILRPLAQSCGMEEPEIRLLGDVTDSYFKMLLEERCAGQSDPETQTERMLTLVEYLLKHRFVSHTN